ncbi:MAG: Crp/Fnr family transcriptional regulator [Planctomycetota bacterium]
MNQVRREHLQAASLFANLSAAELDGIRGRMRRRSLRDGAALFRAGDPGDAAYVIASGQLAVTALSEQGREVLLQLMVPGEMVGELALLDGRPRSATVTAREPVELFVLERTDFLQCLREQPEIALALLKVLSERVRRLSGAFEDSVLLDLRTRLARKLLALTTTFGRPEEGSLRIDVPLTQQALGEMIGATRESVNKWLRSFAALGVLTSRRGVVTILDRAALEEIAALDVDSRGV